MELILIPIIAGVLAALAGKQSRWVALAGSLVSLGITLFWLAGFRYGASFQYVFDKAWFSQGIHFRTGVDGISMVLLLLTNILVPVILLSALRNDKRNAATLFALIVGMQGALNGVFLALDGLMFYIFWELALIPVYFICALWGEGNAFRTTLKFFIYTFIGSLAMLASLIFLYSRTPDPSSFGYEALLAVNLNHTEAIWVGAGILLAFAVKIPMLPLHSWQPDTYSEAPAQGSMLLSGIMLKMGLYGLIRWFFPLVPEALNVFGPVLIASGVIGVLYGALIAIRQNDMKRLVAFSSLSHVGLIAAGIATVSVEGMQGAVLQMFTHGVNVVGLFLAIEVIQSRAMTRNLDALGGIAKQAPVFAVFFLLLVLGTTAVPFTNGFPGELLLLKATFGYKAVWGILAGITIILCAVYMLRMYQFSMLGKPSGGIYLFPDLRWNEWMAFGILALLVLWTGLFPQYLLDLCGPAIQKTMKGILDSTGVVS
ncbi:MAG: NADH-quinone oxidoreductase subunit M [Bacteroidetes bacterium]|nr:NADH-quinone oxidoreductase subunit M [Bacteroidota bacterium]